MPDADIENEAHVYLTHPDKPGVLVSVPVGDIDTTGMICYFARFAPEDGDPDVWNVSFPDLPGCLTCGRGLKQAMANAIDVLGGWLSVAKTERIAISAPSDLATARAKALRENMEGGHSHDHLFLLVPAWSV